MRSTEPAICLRTTDYSETSQVVTFMTRRSGVVRLLAKGTKRPRSKSGGAIDLLVEGELVFSLKNSGTLGILIEFCETVSHLSLRRDSGRLNAALYMIELTGQVLGEGDPHSGVFDLLGGALARLGSDDAAVQAVQAYFQWRLLRHVGLLGGLEQCVSCGAGVAELLKKPDGASVYFSSRQGGLLCADCGKTETEKISIRPATLGALAALAAAEAGKKVTLPEHQARAVNRLLAYHITHQFGKAPKMAKHAVMPTGRS